MTRLVPHLDLKPGVNFINLDTSTVCRDLNATPVSVFQFMTGLMLELFGQPSIRGCT
jgi:hypothetical protein